MDFLTWLRAQIDRVGALVLVVIGAVALLLGWLGASRTPYPPEQMPYLISGAALGLFLVGIGATLWLSADLQDEWRKLDRLETRLEALMTVDLERLAKASAATDLAAAGKNDAEAPSQNGAPIVAVPPIGL